MQVFISWSGAKSNAVALCLRDWLPQVIHSVEPFVSSKDIYAGARWQIEIAQQLEITNFGIICVTADNQTAPWLNFEAGALAKAVDVSRVVPLAIDLTPAEIKNPLGQFQAKALDEVGMQEIALSINAASDAPLPEPRVHRSVTKWWPELHTGISERLDALAEDTPTVALPRSDRDLLEEVVDVVRSLSRTTQRGNPFALDANLAATLLDPLLRELQVAAPDGEARLLDRIIYVRTRDPLPVMAKRRLTELADRASHQVRFIKNRDEDERVMRAWTNAEPILIQTD